MALVVGGVASAADAADCPYSQTISDASGYVGLDIACSASYPLATDARQVIAHSPQGASMESYVATPPGAQQPVPSDGTYFNEFDRKRYYNGTTQVVTPPSSPTSSSSSSFPGGPVKLNPNVTANVALGPGATTSSALSGSGPSVSNPYRYQSTSTFAPPAATSGSGTSTAGSNQFAEIAAHISGVAPQYGVGGVALSRAAAERMAFKLDLQGLAYRDGRIVLSGAKDNDTRLDAATFLTSLRLACGTTDPYFSLDPVNGTAWMNESTDAMSTIWERLKDRFRTEPKEDGFSSTTISVRRELPELWSELAQEYPDLRARLVFHPEWLRQTRFGEILYKADVLLKELTAGAAVLDTNRPLRVRAIPGYVAPDLRGAARSLFNSETREVQSLGGFRLWFDLLPQANAPAQPEAVSSGRALERSKNPGLYAVLRARGYIDEKPPPMPLQRSAFYVSGDVTDLSEVYPKMFVRRHDSVSGEDLPGTSPDLDLLARDVNARSAKYADAYSELRDLTDVFRAYIASVKIAQQDTLICPRVRSIPLSEGEKVDTILPEFRPNELFVTVAQYKSSTRRQRVWHTASQSSVSGGISLRGKEFFRAASVEARTPLTREMHQELAGGVPSSSWTSRTGRQFLAFSIDPREPPPKVPIIATSVFK
ncbi:hypothetical protein HYPDE_26863 [Hyphomicrobium denitrificans 1NES1]|uniref:Uncharacterized protein n=1 Tax=Hyphomicrobium denitrificans 1NES1 TaxID=670307 RepID=N0B293_9HYPH|nr:hypothetical protein HYPDE_26863 [Hyphomicrobium denitrificans 1NES1]